MQVFFGSGLCFFLENNGDPWHDYENHADPYITYFSSFYYMVVTMSTVGYGDISNQTDWGRVFIILYIIGGLSVFANHLPEIIAIIGTRPRWVMSIMPVWDFSGAKGWPYNTLKSRNLFPDVSNTLTSALF